MHFNGLATILAAFVAAPLTAALFPDPQVSLSCTSNEQYYEDWPVSLRFVYDTYEEDKDPEYRLAYYDVNTTVTYEHDEFQTDQPDLAVQYITLTGYGLCYVYDTNGNVTTLLSEGLPQTVVVEESLPQVKGTCYSHRASLIPPWYLNELFCLPRLGNSAPQPEPVPAGPGPDFEPVSKQAPGAQYRRKERV